MAGLMAEAEVTVGVFSRNSKLVPVMWQPALEKVSQKTFLLVEANASCSPKPQTFQLYTLVSSCGHDPGFPQSSLPFFNILECSPAANKTE